MYMLIILPLSYRQTSRLTEKVIIMSPEQALQGRGGCVSRIPLFGPLLGFSWGVREHKVSLLEIWRLGGRMLDKLRLGTQLRF